MSENPDDRFIRLTLTFDPIGPHVEVESNKNCPLWLLQAIMDEAARQLEEKRREQNAISIRDRLNNELKAQELAASLRNIGVQ